MIHTMLHKEAESRQTTVLALRSVAKEGSGFTLDVYSEEVIVTYSQPMCLADGYLPGEVVTRISFPRDGQVVSLASFVTTFEVPRVIVAQKAFAADKQWFASQATTFVDLLADSVGLGFAQA